MAIIFSSLGETRLRMRGFLVSGVWARWFVASLLLTAVVSGDERVDVRRMEDLIYGRKDGMALTLDVFQPESANGCGIVYLVNGGWLSSKSTPRMQNVQPEYYRMFLEQGYTVFAVVTSSQPRYTISDEISDVRRAIRFIRANAARFGVAPDRLGITGASEVDPGFRTTARDR